MTEQHLNLHPPLYLDFFRSHCWVLAIINVNNPCTSSGLDK